MSGPKVDVLAAMDRLCEMIGDEYPERRDADKARAAVAELIEALEGMVSIHDSVTMKQKIERRNEWLPKARAALSNITGATK